MRIKKRGRGAMIAVFLVALVVFGLIYGAWTTITTVFSPPAVTQTTQIPLVIQSGETTQGIADDLYKRGLIRNPLAFRIWARLKGLDTHLQAGAYQLTPGMNIDQIIAKLQNGQPDEKRLAVIDGWRLEQIAAQANSLGLSGFNEMQFLTYTHHPNQFPDAAKYPILQNTPSMEGLLFPNTYFIPVNYNTVQVIDTMLNGLNQVMQQYNLAATAQQHQLSEYQMVILASIVQREAANNGQMPLIAGIYWKRIYQPSSEIGPYLQADPTVQYAYDTDNPPSSAAKYWGHLGNTGGKVDPSSHWNTYKYQGWPPTPIASPNLKALQAAASPAQTNCYYFLSNPKDGSLICASTYQKFQQLEQQYLPQN
jgi:UPF0755 protein